MSWRDLFRPTRFRGARTPQWLSLNPYERLDLASKSPDQYILRELCYDSEYNVSTIAKGRLNESTLGDLAQSHRASDNFICCEVLSQHYTLSRIGPMGILRIAKRVWGNADPRILEQLVDLLIRCTQGSIQKESSESISLESLGIPEKKEAITLAIKIAERISDRNRESFQKVLTTVQTYWSRKEHPDVFLPLLEIRDQLNAKWAREDEERARKDEEREQIRRAEREQELQRLRERRSQALQRLLEPSVRERGANVLRALKAARTFRDADLTEAFGRDVFKLMGTLCDAELVYDTDADTGIYDSPAETFRVKKGCWIITDKGEEYLQETEAYLAEEARRRQAVEAASQAAEAALKAQLALARAMRHRLFCSHGLSLLRALKEENSSKGPAQFSGQWLVNWKKRNGAYSEDAYELLRLLEYAGLISESLAPDTHVGGFAISAEGEKYLQEHET
jgi:hypothetical protein